MLGSVVDIAPNPESSHSCNDQESTQGHKQESPDYVACKHLFGYEGEIATLEGNHARISLDLDTSKHALARVEEEHPQEQVCSLAAHSALGAQLLEALQSQLSVQRRMKNESPVRDGLLDSLRTIRAQYVEVSRALREELTINTSVNADLRAECAARKLAEDALADILLKNFTLVEQNKLLVSQNTSLQNDTSFLISKFAPDHWTQLVLEDKLRSVRTDGKDVGNLDCHSHHLSISETLHTQPFLVDTLLQPQGMIVLPVSISPTADSRCTTLKSRLITVQDELHITKCRLAVAEQRCDTLSAKVSSLQAHISTCVDECGTALEVERELRYEVETRAHELLCETMALKGRTKIAESEFDWKRTSISPWKEEGGHVYQMSNITAAILERCDTLEKGNLKQDDLIRDMSEKLASHEDLQTDAKQLRDDIARYDKLMKELRMKEKERSVDKRLRTKAGKVCNLSLRHFQLVMVSCRDLLRERRERP